MKRILALLLALAMLLALTACGKNDEGAPTGESTGATTNTTESTNTPTDGTQGSTEGTTESTTGNTTTPTTTPTEGSKPTENTKPTGGSTPTTTPTEGTKPTESTTTPTTETQGCQHTNTFNLPDNDSAHPAPTCTKSGYYLKYCSDCHKQWYEETGAKGHTIMETPYDNGYIAPTCCNDGRWGAKEYCYTCKTILKEGDIIPKVYYYHIGETYKINKVEQTWTETGYSGDTCCDGCKNNILPENKGETLRAEKDCPWSTKTYSAENDKIKCECTRHKFLEYREPDPINIRDIDVVIVGNIPGDGVKCIGISITGGSFDYTVDFEVTGKYTDLPNRFYGQKVENSIWDYDIMLKEGSGYYIPDGTMFKIIITDTSGRTFNKTYTVRRYDWHDYEFIAN